VNEEEGRRARGHVVDGRGEPRRAVLQGCLRRGLGHAGAEEERQRVAPEGWFHLEKIERRREEQRKKYKGRVEKQKEPRTSLTDPEARIIKMSDGGYRPAYNFQIAMETRCGAVVGVEPTNESSDKHRIAPMLAQIRRRFGRTPLRWLADAGFSASQDIEHLAAVDEAGIEAFVPLPAGRGGPAYSRQPRVGPAIVAWRERMESERGKAIYKRRSLIEWVNAGMRNRGLTLLTVRGKRKVGAVLLWQALAHNFLCLRRTGTSIAA